VTGYTPETRVLFVCLGNICRSPTTEAVFRRQVADAGLADRVDCASAGTHSFHTGSPPDARAREAAAARGFDLSGIRAQAVAELDLNTFDYTVAMDRANEQALRTGYPHLDGRIRAFVTFAGETGHTEVPDPYYGAEGGFEAVLDLVEQGCSGLLAELRGRARA